MSPTSLRDDTIVQQVTIHAPAKRIFEALTNPIELLKWWGSEGRFRAVEVECDLRPRGKWRMRVESLRGARTIYTTVSGEYRAIEPPRLLAFTWIRDEEDCTETNVRWDLEEADGVTTVRLTHSGLTSESLRKRNDGWPLVLSLLHAYIEQPI